MWVSLICSHDNLSAAVKIHRQHQRMSSSAAPAKKKTTTGLLLMLQDWQRQVARSKGRLLRYKRSHHCRGQSRQFRVRFPVQRAYHAQVWFAWFQRPSTSGRASLLRSDAVRTRRCYHRLSQSLRQGTVYQRCGTYFTDSAGNISGRKWGHSRVRGLYSQWGQSLPEADDDLLIQQQNFLR